MTSEINIINNKKRSRFETEIDGRFAYVDYHFQKNTMKLIHTFVPESARGKGISSALAKFALEYVRDHNLKLVVICPFIKKYMRSHPGYNYLLDKQKDQKN